MKEKRPITGKEEPSLLHNSAAERLPGMATKGTKTPMVPFVLFVVTQHFSPGHTRN
ncbi:MAG: hypothetical protein OXI69_17140 [Acidobacteriota bacterium]|nr:hypothetical protein [Acidobacteriota bacterium]